MTRPASSPTPAGAPLAAPLRLWRELTTGRQRRLVRSMDVDELVRGAQEGSRAHLGQLCANVQDRALAYARYLTRDDDEAWDLLQDVYLVLPARIATYEERGQFLPWLRRLVYHRWLTRDRSTRTRREESLGDTDVPRGGPSITAEVARRDLIDRAMRDMPDALREVWVLLAEGHAPREIAEHLDLTYNAVCVRVHRARHYLASRLDALR